MSDAEPHDLMDLDEDILTHIAAALLHAPSLLALSATCKTFHRLVLGAVDARLVWSAAVAADYDWPLDRASPQLYRALSQMQRFTWRPCEMRLSRQRRRTLDGRTSTAACCLEGQLLMYGGTLNGNLGPVLDDLLTLNYDTINNLLTVKLAKLDPDGLWTALHNGDQPHARRGHSMTTTTSAVVTGTARGAAPQPVACLLGGWGPDEVDMRPVLLRKCADGYRWSRPSVSGAEPEGRAFHSTTEVGAGAGEGAGVGAGAAGAGAVGAGGAGGSAGGVLLVYGGLGQGCCRTDLALLDLAGMRWSTPRVEGRPRVVGGVAGHGAAYFAPRAGRGERAGRLLFLSGASRSRRGDAHQGSIDVLQIESGGGGASGGAASESGGSGAGGESGGGGASSDSDSESGGGGGGGGLRVRWSDETSWEAQVRLPEVRTASYAVLAGGAVVAWSGIREGHEPDGALHVIDARRRTVRAGDVSPEAPSVAHDAQIPAPRGGALMVPVPGAPRLVLMMCGSDHDDEDDMLTPHILELQLPGVPSS